ncbi:hypothetical protein T190_14220 [Sinorhizobium meliloti CCBAU 01290]|nr:hypothetical protein T190_14220 [Sinorhizobium meliloti CCBAU 01290]
MQRIAAAFVKRAPFRFDSAMFAWTEMVIRSAALPPWARLPAE